MGDSVPEKGINGSRHSTMPGKKFSLTQDSVYQKKAYRQVTQWQGKEIRNLDRCISAVMASTLRNPDSSQHQDFNIVLKCVGTLVDYSLMTQYRSHTPNTLAHMERYLQTFHQTKDIFLEFHTSKSTRAEVTCQDWELR